MNKTALITGITGQDGSYLAELLLEKGYQVHGIIRRSSAARRERIAHIEGRLTLHHGDLGDHAGLADLVQRIVPDEIYHLAAQSHVQVSFEQPIYTAQTVALGSLAMLEAARLLARRKPVRFYQASSSEMFGRVMETPQRETTPLRPRSPYGCAKVYAHYQAQNYREAYGLFACSGILFNHESPRRGETFVTRKITRAAARIAQGLQKRLRLGNLDARRDWGFAGDYVEAMWRMLQHDQPDDYVIATGRSRSIRDLLDAAFGRVGLEWQDYVEVDPQCLRPSEVETLCGDAAKARAVLGWTPATSFEQLVAMMVDADLEAARREARGE